MSAIEWKPVPGFEHYTVSSMGDVVGPRGPLSPATSNCGYLQVRLSKPGAVKSTTLHKLVAETFHGPCPEGMEVNHREPTKANCCVDNLFFDTREANAREKVARGVGKRGPARKLPLRPRNRDRDGRCNLTQDQFDAIYDGYQAGMNYTAIAGQAGVGRSTVMWTLFGVR